MFWNVPHASGFINGLACFINIYNYNEHNIIWPFGNKNFIFASLLSWEIITSIPRAVMQYPLYFANMICTIDLFASRGIANLFADRGIRYFVIDMVNFQTLDE